MSSPYKVLGPGPDDWREIIPHRRPAVDPVPLMDRGKAAEIQDTLFEEFGLNELIGCTMGEMKQRPIPHAFQVSKTENVLRLYEKWAPIIYGRLMPLVQPVVQAYNKIARLGWPVLSVPDDKEPILKQAFSAIENEGLSMYKHAYIVPGIRLQPQARSKEREFLFLTKKGVESRVVGEQDRDLGFKLNGQNRTGARTRLIFNLPLPNLYKQVFDTAIHNVLLSFPAFHHNMYSSAHQGDTRPAFAFDVKHFERFTAAVVRARAAIVGGLYAQISALFETLPFLVPLDDWSGSAFILPNREEGWSEQFASGDSAVAPAQKELFLALYAEFVSTHMGMEPAVALNYVLNGGDDSFSILNYGDDNFLFGDNVTTKAAFTFMSAYLDVEEELPLKFLGFLWQNQRFVLGTNSYLSKTYLPERSVYTRFRRYPCLGWLLKRTTYQQIGEDRLPLQVYPREDELLLKIARVRWHEIAESAGSERAKAMSADSSYETSNNVLLDKEYLATDAERIASGRFIGFTQAQTAPMLRRLIGQDWHHNLKF